GGAWRAAALRVLEVHVLGRAGSRPAVGGKALLSGGPREVAGGPRRTLRGGDGERVERVAKSVRAVLRLRRPGRLRLAYAAHLLRGPQRSTHAGDSRRDPLAGHPGRARR